MWQVTAQSPVYSTLAGRLADVLASKFTFKNLVFITCSRLVIVTGKLTSITESYPVSGNVKVIYKSHFLFTARKSQNCSGSVGERAALHTASHECCWPFADKCFYFTRMFGNALCFYLHPHMAVGVSTSCVHSFNVLFHVWSWGVSPFSRVKKLPVVSYSWSLCPKTVIPSISSIGTQFYICDNFLRTLFFFL